MPGRLAVRLTRDAERQVRGGHPWVFDAAVRSVRPAGGAAVEDSAAGDLAVVFDDRRKFVAVGLWDPGSPIRIRILQRGEPRAIDQEWFAERIAAAATLRSPLEHDPGTTGYRLVHGENDGLPGLVLDRYDDTLVLKLYSSAWFPHLGAVLEAIAQRHAPRRVVLRLARVLGRGRPYVLGGDPLADGRTLLGEAPDGPVTFTENGLRFEADVVRGQKTGYFLDQRENRAAIGALSRGSSVLDVFSCGGGFSVYAAAGGAELVHSVDISPAAIAAARRNMALNRDRAEVARCHHEVSTGDASEVMRAFVARGRRFDVVVVDPPSFAARQRQVDGALAAYARLTALAVELVEPGGHLLQASCSARVGAQEFFDTVLTSAQRAGADLSDVRFLGHAVDHPVGFEHGAYLKAVLARRH
jgi:23S rRNA (cytosine1962-C5)-methyltransferase